MARWTSGIPGPSSRATIVMPRLLPEWTSDSNNSPRSACSTMLRVTSEMAVAISVRSEPLKPAVRAMPRASSRAVTMSSDRWIGMRASFLIEHLALRVLVQVGKPFLQIKGRPHAFQGQTQLDHCEGDIRLDADNDCLRATQLEHVRDGAQGSRGERIDDVQDGDVDDDPPGTVFAHALGEVIAQLYQIGIGKGRLNAGDEILALL